jgi:hypothetical protein
MASNTEMSHSDPGTGSPPAPNTKHDDATGDRKNSGSRRDAPAIINPNAATVSRP